MSAVWECVAVGGEIVLEKLVVLLARVFVALSVRRENEIVELSDLVPLHEIEAELVALPRDILHEIEAELVALPRDIRSDSDFDSVCVHRGKVDLHWTIDTFPEADGCMHIMLFSQTFTKSA